MYSRNILFSLYRGNFEEIAVHGELIVVDGSQVLFETAEVIGTYPARSLLKPFQFLATGLASQTWVEEDLRRYTACVGSISATQEQVAQLLRWYQEPAWEKMLSKLLLPPSYPMDEKERVQAKLNGTGPKTYFHTCFSKHLGILQGCLQNHWPLDEYLSETHPFHQRLLGTLGALLKEDLHGVPCVTDGCLLPSPVLSLKQTAHLYQKLASAPPTNALGKIRAAMMQNPQWVGGPKRVDTLLMELNPGKLVAKEGADGLLGMGVLPCDRHPEGLGIIVKLAMGYQPNFAAVALMPLLESLHLKTVHEAPRGHEVRFQYKPFVGLRSDVIDISPRVGKETAVWPGDQGFCAHRSLDASQGDHLTLSSMATTVHVGAHTDAPCHFIPSAPGIDQVMVEKYLGPCQVIEVTKSQHSTIRPEDIAGIPLLARRILFKTDSFPNPSTFNEDFVALSPELIHYLGKKNVVLVGIDTPSIDLFESKTLEAHQATVQYQMAILEGICFDGLEAGVYELIALPLKLEGLDASPVRAVLRRI